MTFLGNFAAKITQQAGRSLESVNQPANPPLLLVVVLFHHVPPTRGGRVREAGHGVVVRGLALPTFLDCLAHAPPARGSGPLARPWPGLFLLHQRLRVQADQLVEPREQFRPQLIAVGLELAAQVHQLIEREGTLLPLSPQLVVVDDLVLVLAEPQSVLRWAGLLGQPVYARVRG